MPYAIKLELRNSACVEGKSRCYTIHRMNLAGYEEYKEICERRATGRSSPTELLLTHPIRRLMHAFRQNPLWRNYSSQSFGASSILLLKAAGAAIYASEIPPCRHLRPIANGLCRCLLSSAKTRSGHRELTGVVQPGSSQNLFKSYAKRHRGTRSVDFACRNPCLSGSDGPDVVVVEADSASEPSGAMWAAACNAYEASE
jgi:hypothetical protein